MSSYGLTRATVGRLGVFFWVVAMPVLACDCGNGNPGRDADAGEDRADDVVDMAEDAGDEADGVDVADEGFEEIEVDIPEVVDVDAEDAGERYIAPWDGDLDYSEYAAAHDCTPPEPIAECETPGAETPIWERAVGDEWCISPSYRDLRPIWREVAPGCEQVTYLDVVGGPAASPAFGVWDGMVIVLGQGLTVVDADCRSEQLIQREEHAEDGSYITDGWPQSTISKGLHSRFWRTDASGYSSALVSYDYGPRTKRIVHVQHNPDRGDSHGTLYPLDASFGTVLASRDRLRELRCEFDIVSVDILSGAVLELSGAALPFGRCVWAGSLWGSTGVVSGSSWNLHLVDVTSPGVRVFGETAPCQWNAVIQGDTVCWEQTTEFCPLSGGFGGTIWCSDLRDDAPWNASPDVHCADGTLCWACGPTVFGPWVAWVLSQGASCDGQEIALLNRRTAREHRLFDRTAGFRPLFAYKLRLWGHHLYFQTDEAASSGSMSNVFRCDLRVLFPEEYE